MTETVRARLGESVVEGRRLGRHVEHDPRSRDFPAVRKATPAGKLGRVHHRHYRVLDQDVPKPLGSCTGNAVAGALNTLPIHRKGRPIHDEEAAVAIYSLATRLDGFDGEYPPDDTGSSGLAACKAATEMGLLTEYRHAFGIAEALTALQSSPVVTGVGWYEGFDEPDEGTGLVRVAGQVRGGHEFLIVGYEPAANPDDATLLAVNSWGEGWGLRGRFRFTVATWSTLLDEQGDVTVILPA